MNAIRPLLTLTVLLVLGVLLWHRISNPGLTPPTEQLEPVDVAEGPALSTGTSDASSTAATSTATSSSSAPAWTPDTTTPAAAASTETRLAATANSITPIEPGALSSLPPLPAIPGTTNPPAPAGSGLPLPDNIPTANYEGTTPADTAATPPVAAPVSPPPTATLPPDGGITPVEENVLAGGTGSATAPPTAESAPAPSYGPAQEFGPPPSQFAAARAEIDRALAQGDLKTAHKLLTTWYGDRTLTQEEQLEVGNLLGQLAGTVVYSTDYPLEPPHTVAAGETLETIAQKYGVPWQLLAKINGIPTPDAVTPGQSIKVLRGPFSAVVDVDRQEMALMVSGLYAGRFSVKTEGMAAGEGEWTVAEKKLPAGAETAPKHVVLTCEITPGSYSSIVLGTMSVDSPAAQAGAIRVSPSDQEDLFDILSVGSKVIIRK